jgi:hypothetical protein
VCFALVVHYQLPFWKPKTSQSVPKLSQQLPNELSHPDVRVFVLDDERKRLLKTVKRVPESLVYDRKAWKRANV